MKLLEKSDGSAFLVATGRGRVDLSKQVIGILKKKLPKLFKGIITLTVSGYPARGITALHKIVMDSFPEKRKEAETKWTEHIKNGNPLNIMHIDDNRLNFNIENLMWGPKNLNEMQKKCFPRKTRYGTWEAKLTVNGKKETIKAMPTEDEVKHQIDINKIRRAPADFRDYLFEHAMHRPEAFEEYYMDIPTLLSREILARKQSRKKNGSKSVYNTFSTLDDFYSSGISDELKNVIRDIFLAVNITPFDSSLDYVVYTRGGKGKERVFLIMRECYERLILPDKYAMGESKGYLQLSNPQQQLHVAIMDRYKANDGLLVRHGPGGHLDNRKRTLLEGTTAENMGDRGIENQVSRYLGVYKMTDCKRKKPWCARISLENGDIIYIGSFETEDEAGRIAEFAQDNRAHLKEATKGMELKESCKYVRKFCEKLMTT
jgi:hypothetical protein